jgi:hypothetical protein
LFFSLSFSLSLLFSPSKPEGEGEHQVRRGEARAWCGTALSRAGLPRHAHARCPSMPSSSISSSRPAAAGSSTFSSSMFSLDMATPTSSLPRRHHAADLAWAPILVAATAAGLHPHPPRRRQGHRLKENASAHRPRASTP